MTTIAYKDGVIAYDSIITCNGSVIYKDYDKSAVVDGVWFFIAGAICDYPDITSDWFTPKRRAISARALVVDESGNIFECGYGEGKMWRERLFEDQHVAIGSGWQFALMAMDLGLSAEDAVKKTSERCIYTGGTIRTFKIDR